MKISNYLTYHKIDYAREEKVWNQSIGNQVSKNLCNKIHGNSVITTRRFVTENNNSNLLK